MSIDPAYLALRFALQKGRTVQADLSPPLGYPGGECHVIERIEAEVLNPREREKLIKKVERGEDFDKADEKRVYKKDHVERGALGTQFKWIALGMHAQFRMDLRGVTVPEILLVLKDFHKVFSKEKSRQSYRYKAWVEDIRRGERFRWEKNGAQVVFIPFMDPQGQVGAMVVSAIRPGVKHRPMNREDCKPFEGWSDQIPEKEWWGQVRMASVSMFRDAASHPNKITVYMLEKRAAPKFFKLDAPAAHRALNPFVGPWVFHNDGGAKRKLMAAYLALNARRKAALESEVARAMSGPTIVYRWLREGDSPTKMGGASVTEDPAAFGFGANVHAFKVTPKDVMLHYGQQDSWLSSKRYGHEKEMILKPDATPQHLGQFDTETQTISRTALKMPPVPGVKTLVRDDSAKGLPNTLDRTKEVALPPDAANPGGHGRDIPKFEFNTPDNDIDERPRKHPEPGEDRGHPVNDSTGTVKRRTMTSAARVAAMFMQSKDPCWDGYEMFGMKENEKGKKVPNCIPVEDDEKMGKEGRWKRRWQPGKRQRRQKGPAKTKSRQYYRRNRSKILRKQKIRRSKSSWKNNSARKRSEKIRSRTNRKRIGSACPSCLALKFAENAPPRERGGVGGQQQREQARPERLKDEKRYRRKRNQMNRDSQRYYEQECKRNPNCMRRREEYREDPDYYKRRPPKNASVLTVPDIAFVIGPNMVLGYVDSLSPLSGMVNFRLAESDVSQMGSLPVEVFLRAATLLSDEDLEAMFELIDVEIGLEAYEDLDEERLRECAGLYDVDPDAEDFKQNCVDLVGDSDFSSMSADQLDTVNDSLVMGVLEGGGEPRTQDSAAEGDEGISELWDPHLFYGEVEASKTASWTFSEGAESWGYLDV